MISLEYIAPEDWRAVERVRQALQSLVIDTGGQSIGVRFGTQTFNWAGGVNQKTITGIAHGLGRTPAVVLAVNGSNTTTGDPHTHTYASTTFTMDIFIPNGTNPAAATADVYYWVAIG